ncbi:MAG TPA: HEAT repeat domain-containing protein [Pirellulales bacterium]
MSHSDPSPQKPALQDHLPPVQAPTGAFVVQLFVVPAVIVGVIAVLYGLFFWWGQVRNDDAEKYVQALDRDNQARWQAAVSLADALRDPRNVELKQNAKIAVKLADVLEREIAAGSTDNSDLQLRVYLCHALGEFQVADGVPALLLAAKTQREPDEKYVRFAALKALAVFVSRPGAGDRGREQILPVMLDASHDPEPLVRSTAAFALGALGGPQAVARLERMLTDASSNVRFNAATMLATQGQLAAVPVLTEMLDPKLAIEAGPEEEDEPEQDNKRIAVMVNGLRAARKLSAKHPGEQLNRLRDAVQQLEASREPASVRLEAVAVAKEMAADAASEPAH